MPKPISDGLTPYQRHVARWSDCQLCDLCKYRKKVVLLRGSIPADVLFVGEAPGESEDVLGRPFVGPAGKLLDSIVEQSGANRFRLAFTNLVACIPKDETLAKAGEPSKDHIYACSDRLAEIVRMVQPYLIVEVGALSSKHLLKVLGDNDIRDGLKVAGITHPAALLRMPIDRKGLAIQRSIVTLRDAVEELVPF